MLTWLSDLLSSLVPSWLAPYLPNAWMTNDTIKGRMLHAIGGYAVLMTAGFLTKSLFLHLVVWAGLLAYTVVKEFWYDVKYEVPPQDLKGGLTDLSWIHVGAAIAMAIVTLL